MDEKYSYEIEALKRERLLKEQIVESYRNKIINELLEGNNPIVHEVVEPPKKSFWKRLFSAL